MPAKFKPSQKVYKRGVPASKLPTQHFYLKNTPKDELFAEINKSSVNGVILYFSLTNTLKPLVSQLSQNIGFFVLSVFLKISVST